MELQKAKAKATELIEQHCPDFTFKFDNAKVRFGCCNYRTKTISLSKHLVAMNDEAKVTDTILHEIAHAIVGKKHNHDFVWRAKAIEIGCDGNRCYDGNKVSRPKGKFTYECPECNKEHNYHRRLKRATACGDCCREKNFGRFSYDFQLKPKGWSEPQMALASNPKPKPKNTFTLKRWKL